MAEPDALLDYFAALERRGWEITINDFSGLVVSDGAAASRFADYFIHRNPFCMAVKAEARLWNECLRRKTALCAAAAARKECFRGACFCGREEYVAPVIKDGIVLATIALGGFAADREADLSRADRAFGAGGSDGSPRPAGRAYQAAFAAATAAEDPGERDARALLGIAAAELLRLYESLEMTAGRLVVPDAARLSRERRLVLHAAEYLRRHATGKADAAAVAASCHVSVSTLSHVFKKIAGLSLRAYLLRLRLESAKERLRSGASVTEAALDSGFDDPDYFSRAFAAAEGLPPSRWKAV